MAASLRSLYRQGVCNPYYPSAPSQTYPYPLVPLSVPVVPMTAFANWPNSTAANF